MEVHLQDGLFERAGHAPVALEDLGEEGHLAGARHADLLDVASGGREGAPVVAVTLAEAALGALAMLGLKLGVHFLLHDLLEDALDGVADAVLERGGDGLFEFVVGHHRLDG